MGISSIDISASGMRAQRLRMELIANNLANVETTRSDTRVERAADGTVHLRALPYRRKVALFEPGIPGSEGKFGVSVRGVVDDLTDFRAEQNPEHPDAVKTPGAPDLGTVYYPNVNPIVEMVDMISASRAYEANVTAVDTLKTMGQANLRILA